MIPRGVATVLVGIALGCSGTDDGIPADVRERLLALSPEELPGPPPDPTNRFADDPAAAALGHALFFDPRFSGPLLDQDNDGAPGTLGIRGEPQKVSCESCHLATAGFSDKRSPRAQLSLASGWTRRRTPSLLDVGQAKLLTWDGRRDAMFNQVFGVIESPLEYNSSRLFVAQQIARHYADEYETIFGPLPDGLAAYAEVTPELAGCTSLPTDPVTERCVLAGHDDPAVITVLVNMGKALGAYQRRLACGPSRFDAWMHGDATAMTAEEQAGAAVFIRAGCDNCHAGPYFTDQQFHNIGAANLQNNFIAPYDDPGAAAGLAALLDDPLSSRGRFSDGTDDRLDPIPPDLGTLTGAFRTPGLRCVDGRPSYFHAGQKRSLEDAVGFFNKGPDAIGYQGTPDPLMVPLGLTDEERTELTAFLRALSGDGPPAELTEPPTLPL